MEKTLVDSQESVLKGNCKSSSVAGATNGFQLSGQNPLCQCGCSWLFVPHAPAPQKAAINFRNALFLGPTLY
jgi:hypothetical protein